MSSMNTMTNLSKNSWKTRFIKSMNTAGALKYPLSRFTLEQLVNVARLQVEEESEMSLEHLRFTRQQLLEYQQE
nr:hypothetical protein [Tanacetum cinerariifolium]